MSLQHTDIEWVKNPDGTPGYSWNPVTGCLNHTNGLCNGGGFPCYAYKLAHGRVKQCYLDNYNVADNVPFHTKPIHYPYYDPFYPRIWPGRLRITESRKPRGVFVCDMSDLFGIGIPEEWTRMVLDEIKLHPDDRFYLLTKQPQNLLTFSPFPDNCWVGVTATNAGMADDAGYYLTNIQAKVRFLSIEPLLGEMKLYFSGLDWLIIGACTGSRKAMETLCQRYPELTLMPWEGLKYTAQPRLEWVREIIQAAERAGIPVFLKDNLLPLFPDASKNNVSVLGISSRGALRQQLPISI